MKISIIVPIYNTEKYLIRCVDSLLNQNISEDDYEIILVNDGSTDHSGELVDSLAEKYRHVKAHHKKNGGLSDARNFGLRQSKGDYIWFIIFR